MATSTKEFGPVTSLAQDNGNLTENGGPTTPNAGGQRPARADAVGVEIPVVVHASRRSVSDQGVSKALPALHEEAHTAIVFPQGCVVRLSASLVVGELIVLTNRQGGADALCRVISIKTRPGTQNYVDLEFMQRAPGFWGECFKVESPGRTESSKSTPAVPIAAKVPAIVTPVQRPASVSPLEVDAASPVCDALPHFDQPPAVPIVAPSSKSVLETSASLPPAQSGHAEESTAVSAQRVPPSSMILTKSAWAAAAVLVVIGLTAGGFLLGRRGRTASTDSPAEVAAALTTVPKQPVGATSANQLPISDALEPVATGPVATALAETSTEEQTAFERARENSRNTPPSSRPSVIGAGKIAKPIANIRAKATASEPPPILQTRGNNVTDEMLVSGVLSSTGRASVPEPPLSVAAVNSIAHSDGQLQPPEPVAMPAPIYPAYAREMHVHGVVVLDALVDVTGKVTKVKVVSGPTSLQQAAMDAVLQFRYRPGRLNGQPTATHINVDISFTHE